MTDGYKYGVETIKPQPEGALAESAGSPFVVPDFAPPPPLAITYYVWSWHPLYPNWSQSCWHAATIEEAMKLLDDPAKGFDVYHNKIIRHDGRTLVEVRDAPCKRLDIWWKIKRQMDTANGD